MDVLFLDSINTGHFSDAADNPNILSRNIHFDSEDNFNVAGNLLHN